MKKVILLLAISPVFVSSITPEPIQVSYEETIVEVKRKDIQLDSPTPTDLIDALILVESRGNDSAIGDRHLVGNEAVGALQIRPIMVREVNRILKLQGKIQRFKLKDRFDRQKSINMFIVWKKWHHPNSDLEKIARNWNGGPRGYQYERTFKYWLKVQKELNNVN
tara:strand:- start:1647 stop:2141 length:495 start_codon:yes stop_codon:yes gene_type:complete